MVHRRRKLHIYYHIATRQQIQIYLEPDKQFSADVHGQKLVDPVYFKLERKIDAKLSGAMQLQFKPVIVLESLDHGSILHVGTPAFVGFCVHRTYWAADDKGALYEAGWDLVQNKGIEAVISENLFEQWRPGGLRGYEHRNIKFTVPGKYADFTYLEYDEQTWEGVQQLVQAVGKIREAMDTILSGKDFGVKALKDAAAAGGFLLQPGPDQKGKKK